MSLNEIISKISRNEVKNQLKLKDVKAPWFGVLCDPIDKNLRRHKQYQILCTRMFTYLLGGGVEDDERDDLREKFFNARKTGSVDSEDQKEKAYDASGEIKKFNIGFHLPNPWQ